MFLFNITRACDIVLRPLDAQIFNHKREIYLNTLQNRLIVFLSF